MQSLDSSLAIALKAEKVYDVEKLWRQKRDGEVEDAVAKADGGHQAFDGVGRN